jgi:hypothetical protein
MHQVRVVGIVLGVLGAIIIITGCIVLVALSGVSF